MAAANDNGQVLPEIDNNTDAFSHIPEHGFSLFLANRTKTIHFVRHAEGTHNEANRAHGDDTPVTFSTPGCWRYMDAYLTGTGIAQCVKARQTLLQEVHPQLIVVSPFSRTLQTAHIMFNGKNIPFLVQDLCKERSGRYTCDKRRPRQEVVAEFGPVYDATNDTIDFTSFGFQTEQDLDWSEARESSDSVTNRAIAMMRWLATRPEKEIAVVTHSSWLKHLFRAFGEQVEEKDQARMHRLAGNAEVRSICLAMHRGFYPDGEWDGDTYIPSQKSFRRFRYAPTNQEVTNLHQELREKKQE